MPEFQALQSAAYRIRQHQHPRACIACGNVHLPHIDQDFRCTGRPEGQRVILLPKRGIITLRPETGVFVRKQRTSRHIPTRNFPTPLPLTLRELKKHIVRQHISQIDHNAHRIGQEAQLVHGPYKDGPRASGERRQVKSSRSCVGIGQFQGHGDIVVLVHGHENLVSHHV